MTVRWELVTCRLNGSKALIGCRVATCRYMLTRKRQKVETKRNSQQTIGDFSGEKGRRSTLYSKPKKQWWRIIQNQKKTSLIGVGLLEAVLSCSVISSCAVIVLFSIQNFLIHPYCCTNLITIWAIRWKLKRNDFPSKSVLLVTKPSNGFGALID